MDRGSAALGVCTGQSEGGIALEVPARPKKTSGLDRLEARGLFVALPRGAFVLRTLLGGALSAMWLAGWASEQWRAWLLLWEQSQSSQGGVPLEAKTLVLASPGLELIGALMTTLIVILGIALGIEVVVIVIIRALAPGARMKRRVLQSTPLRSTLFCGLALALFIWGSIEYRAEIAPALSFAQGSWGVSFPGGAWLFALLCAGMLAAALLELIQARQQWSQTKAQAALERHS